MDTTNNKKLFGLEQSLGLYSVLWLIFFGFLILILILLITNIKGFNKSFGYQIFITLPFILLITFLINEILTFKSNPNESFFSNFNISIQPWFMPFMTLITVCISLLGFFMMLYVGGIFSNPPPENNTAMLLNVFIILAFIIISVLYYKNSVRGLDQTLPKITQMAINMRTKYTIIFMIFIVLMGLLFLVNPFNLMTDYSSPVMFFTLFVGILLVIMIYFYQIVLSDPNKFPKTSILTIIVKAFYILFALGASFGLIYAALHLMGIFDQDFSDP